MANVKVNMDKGNFSAKGGDVSTAEPSLKVRKKKTGGGWVWPHADPDKVARLRALDIKKQKLAAKRGATKNATAAQIREARAVSDEAEALKAEIITEQREAMGAHRTRELAKQEAAKKKELARSGKH